MQPTRECWFTVTSAHWAAVDWSWPSACNWRMQAHLHLKNNRSAGGKWFIKTFLSNPSWKEKPSPSPRSVTLKTMIFVYNISSISGLQQTYSTVPLSLWRPFMTLYTMQTLSDVLLDCWFSSRSWATSAGALEVGLKSWRMPRADSRCIISNVDFRCCFCLISMIMGSQKSLTK